MVLVWKGWGILSGIIAVAAYVAGLAVSDLQGGWSFFAIMAAAAVINGFLGWWLNRSRREANAALLKSSNQPKTATVPPRASTSGIYRETMTQPGVYWMLDAPFVRICGGPRAHVTLPPFWFALLCETI